MLLAAMLAMVLVAAAPALAQVNIEGDEGDTTTTNQYVDCTQVQAAAADQNQYGDANAGADDESEAVADIAQELGISQEAVQNCIAGDDNNVGVGDVDGDGAVEDVAVDGVDNDGDGAVDEADGTEAAAASSSAASSSAAAGTSVLPDTGGASLFTLGAGALLVGGGLLARRIFS
jgi:hypothetical protein